MCVVAQTDAPPIAYKRAMVPKDTSKIQHLGLAALGHEASPASASNDVAVGDWDDLFNAVQARLRLTVDEWLATGNGNDPPDPSVRMNSVMLECAGALDQLHGTLVNEAGRRHQLELAIADSHAALAQARIELAAARESEERAHQLAQLDGLTLLPNRSLFRDQLDQALARAIPRREAVAVLYVDLEGLKPVQKDIGADAGDELLKIVAGRLAQAVRADGMVGRLGNDEFACLLLDVPSREQLSHLACNLLDAISAPIKIGVHEISVRPAIGIALSLGDPTSPQALLDSADAATRRARQLKSGYAFFDDRGEMAHDSASVAGG